MFILSFRKSQIPEVVGLGLQLLVFAEKNI